jgi:hypothetical protein
MTGLFRNLASVARGEPIPGAANVALPPRFAASTAVAPEIDVPPQDQRSQQSQPASAPPHRPLQNAATANDRVAPQVPWHDAQTESDEIKPRSCPSPRAVATPESRSAPSNPTVTPPAVSAEIAAPPPAPYYPLPLTLPHNAAHHDAPPPRDAAPTRRQAPPLGDAVLAGQSLRRRETPPIIQVTIDRIDIRSPEPPRAAGTGKAPPKPSVSLADYLRRTAPGGRP